MNYLVYNGPSQIDATPIMGVLTGFTRPSINAKTGPLIQLWILLRDKNPLAALQDDTDTAICGSCPLRKTVCYVNVAQGPNTIWRSTQRQWSDHTRLHHGMPDKSICRQRGLRLGAYGDPGALPLEVIKALVGRFRHSTGYTHLWREQPGLKTYCMASVESLDLAREAQDLGWRTYRIQEPGETRVKGEALCPYEAAQLTCDNCQACNGTQGPFTSNIVSTVHGIAPKIIQFKRLAAPTATP